jgi:hypothetical protein
MNFLNAALLPSLVGLLAAPLLIHLLNLRFPKLFEFSTVRHLRQTIAQSSRLFRWRHRILLLLRTLFALALLLAFLKPLLPRFGSKKEGNAPRTVLIVIDHSLSMEHMAGGVTARQRAQAEAGKILDTLKPRDSVNVLLAGATPQMCFTDLSQNQLEARRFIDNLKAGLTRGDFSQVTTSAGRLLARENRRSEVYYISDFQRKNWSNIDFTSLPADARVFFVDVAARDRANHAILGAALSQTQVLAGDTVTLEVEVGNYRDEPLRESLKAVVDERSAFEKEVSVAPWSSAKVSIPVAAGSPGLHLCEVSLPADNLPQDDRFCLTIPVMEKEGVLIVSDAPDPEKDAVLYLKTALNPYENSGGSILPQQVRAAQLDAGKLAAVKKLFLTRSGRLSEAACKLVADFIFHGGGVAYFLDGETDAENLAALQRAMGTQLPLKLGQKRIARNIGTGGQQIIRGEFSKSRFLRLFRGAQRQDLSLLEFYDITDASATGAGQVLLTYADETPAMAGLSHGLGTLLLMNFSVSEFSSNLARQRIFPAWMQEIVKNLSTDEPVASSSVAGEIVTDEVWKRELQETGLNRPSGGAVEVKAEAMGERVAMSFVPDELGFYTMRAKRLLHAYAVNVSPEESDLRTIDRSLLPDQLSEKGARGYFVEGRQDFEEAAAGRAMFHWFVLAGLTLLVIEQFFQLWMRRPAPGSASLQP